MSPSKKLVMAVKVCVGAVALVASMAFAATPASAEHVRCGQVILVSTVLDSNVGPCPNNGVIIGNDNVTLDLNGHQIFGTGKPGDGAGVLVSQRRNVEVRNGTVRHFDGGVVIEGGSDNRVLRVTAKDNIGKSGSTPSAPGTQYGDGIAILSSSNNLVEGNTALHNGPYSGIGVFERVDSDHPRQVTGPAEGNVIRRNQVLANNICRTPHGPCDNDGIRLEPGVQFNTVAENYVRGSALDGISLFRTSDDNVVVGNTVEHNGHHRAAHRKGDGIRVFSNRNLVENNRSFHNGADGIGVGFRTPRGVIVPATNNRIIANRTGFNRVFDLHDFNPGCDANVWSRNTYRTAEPPCTRG